jgi:hypothetical protein
LDFELDYQASEKIKKVIMSDNKYELFAVHKTFRDGLLEGEVNFPFFQKESLETIRLYALGALMLLILNRGHILVIKVKPSQLEFYPHYPEAKSRNFCQSVIL